MIKRRIIPMFIIFMILSLLTIPSGSAEAATKASYTMQKKEITWMEGDTVRGEVSFQYPKLNGNSNEIAEINSILENAMTAFMADERVEGIKESTEYYIDNKLFTEDVKQLYWKTTCKVTYNAKNIISMHMKEMWYAGGVYNQKDYGYTFDLKTGKALTLAQAVGVKPGELTNRVLASAKKYFEIGKTDNYTAVWEGITSIIKEYDTKTYKYYLIPGKARVCFESYELNCGTSYQVLSITGKYK